MGYDYPGGLHCNRETTKQIVYLNSKISEGSWNGPGERAVWGLGWGICAARQLMVKDLEYRSSQVFKGGRAGRWHHATSLWDVQHLPDVRWCSLRLSPGNHCLQMTSPVLRTLTASRASVTKASGLSDAPGAERSPNGEDGDTMTHIYVFI